MATDFGNSDDVDTLDAEASLGTLLESDRFLAGLSHELRTPLNAILGFTGTLLMQLPGPLNEEQERQLRTVQCSARHLLALINDMLDLGRAGTLDLHPEPLNCRSIIEKLAQVFRPQARHKGLVLQFRAPPQALVLRTDRRALLRIMTNLVHNAIKFTERGEISIGLERKLVAGRQVVQFSVSDTGARVAHEGLQQMGIQLSHKLAEILNGSIRYFDKSGNGSIFVLSLPQE